MYRNSSDYLLTLVKELPPVPTYGGPFVFAKLNTIANITPITTLTTSTACSINSSNPKLPKGLSLDTKTCIISGTPEVLVSAQVFTITATNSGGSSNASVSITVNPVQKPNISYFKDTLILTRENPLPAGITPTNLGGAISSCSLASDSPVLPKGLNLDSKCNITGKPTDITAEKTYRIIASNEGGISPTAEISIKIKSPPPGSLGPITDPTYIIRKIDDKPVYATDSDGVKYYFYLRYLTNDGCEPNCGRVYYSTSQSATPVSLELGLYNQPFIAKTLAPIPLAYNGQIYALSLAASHFWNQGCSDCNVYISKLDNGRPGKNSGWRPVLYFTTDADRKSLRYNVQPIVGVERASYNRHSGTIIGNPKKDSLFFASVQSDGIAIFNNRCPKLGGTCVDSSGYPMDLVNSNSFDATKCYQGDFLIRIPTPTGSQEALPMDLILNPVGPINNNSDLNPVVSRNDLDTSGKYLFHYIKSSDKKNYYSSSSKVFNSSSSRSDGLFPWGF